MGPGYRDHPFRRFPRRGWAVDKPTADGVTGDDIGGGHEPALREAGHERGGQREAPDVQRTAIEGFAGMKD